MNNLTQELGELLKEVRRKVDRCENLNTTMVKVDAAIDKYDDAYRNMNNPIQLDEGRVQRGGFECGPKTRKPEIIPKGQKSVKEDTANHKWTIALNQFLDELGAEDNEIPDGPIEPEEMVNRIRMRVNSLEKLAADEELDECCELISKRYQEIPKWLRNTRRPSQTLKHQALKDFETIRKNSYVIPEILDTVEQALNSIPE